MNRPCKRQVPSSFNFEAIVEKLCYSGQPPPHLGGESHSVGEPPPHFRGKDKVRRVRNRTFSRLPHIFALKAVSRTYPHNQSFFALFHKIWSFPHNFAQ